MHAVFSSARLTSLRCIKSLVLMVPVLLCLQARAAVQLDASSTGVAVQGSTTLSFMHPLGNGGNRMVVCGVTFGYNDTALTSPIAPAPTMTFNGVAMTSALQTPTHAVSSTAKIYSQIFYISDTSLGMPAAGAYPVNVSNFPAVTGGVSAGCSSFFGIAQPGTLESPVAVYSGSALTPATLNLTGLNAGDLVVDAFAGGYGSSGSATVGSGQTQLYNVQQASGSKTTAASNGGEVSAGSYLLATGGTASVSWTNAVARVAYSAVAFLAAPTTSYSVTTAVTTNGAAGGAGGTVSLSPTGGNYNSGTVVSVTANPAIGYAFNGFSGDLSGTTNPGSLTVNGNKSVTAAFVTAPCTLTTNTSGMGSVTLSPSGGTYTCGTQIQVTGVPAQGYSFGNFSGALTGSTNPQTLTLNQNSTVTATFVQGSSCTLSTSTTGSGTITVSPAGNSFSCGTSLTITANPAQYYSLTGFSGSITGTTNPQTYVINANSSIAAAFAQTTYPINTTITGPGSVTANPADTGNGYAAGTSVTLTATPAAGANFTGFSGAITGTTNPQSLTVNSTVNVTATFVAQTITQDAISHGVSSGTAASAVSWQHVLGAGGSRAVVISIGVTDSAASPDAAAAITSVLFNGIYATPIPGSFAATGTSGNVQTQLFYLLESELPAAGTYTITATLAGTVSGIQGGAVSFFNVNQGPAEAVIVHKDGSGANLISTAITTLTNNAVVIDIVEDNSVAALTANSGQAVVFTASAPIGTGGSSTKVTPTAGSTTLGWAGNASRLVHSLAAFPPATSKIPATYALTTSVAGGVGGTITTNPGLSQFPVSTGVLLTANAATGYTFSNWTGDYNSTANPLPITMDQARNVVANFSTAATCTLTINIVGQGTVTPSAGTYNCGTAIHFNATPAAGYMFTSYSGDFNSTDNPTTFTISSNANVTVEFDPINYCTLTVTSANGSVSPGSGNFTCGTVVKLQATANSGYGFAGYSGDINTTANPASVQLNSNTNVTANFTAGSACALTSSVTAGSGVISPASGSWACGTVIAIEADPAAKYTFSGWGGALAGTTVSPTMLTMSTNQNVTASFTVNSSGVTGDTRIITEPVYPGVCTVLTALQSSTGLVESSPDTARVQAALNACPSGKAVEFVSNGSANAFILQPITLPAGVTMIVDAEVTIFGSINSKDYPCSSSSFCTPLIDVAANAYPNTGSAIMGNGVIDGRGGTPLTDLKKSWWATGSDARPRLVYLSSNANTVPADNFTMYKITLKNSPKFEFSGIGNYLTIWGVKVIAPPDSPNTDGIDPSSSQNITITNSYVSTGDDMIAMKAGNGHIANVTISNNHMYSGHGITIGSETNAGLNNMLVIGNAIDNGFGGSSADSLRIKSDTSRGGEVYDVLYKNTCVNHGGDTVVIDPYYSSQTGSLIPNFHDITFSNFHQLIHNSSFKSTFTGYNTNGIINPLTVTLDNVSFDGDAANDVKAPDQVNNTQFTFGPGPVNIASFLTASAQIPSNYITVTNSVSNSNPVLDCSTAFVYLAGDLTAHASAVTAGTSPTVIAVLQNVVSPLVAGTISYPQQNMPTGNIQLLEGTTVVGTAAITAGSRVTTLTIPSITAGTHTYTANYLGDSNFSTLAFGTYTIVATNAAPVAANQSVTVPFNTAGAITLNATGSGTLVYSVVATPTHGTLTGTAPNLTYTPTSGYAGADSFTFKANNGTDSNIATVTITVQSAGGTASQTISFPALATPVTYGAAAMTLNATASSSLTVSYMVSGPGALNGNTLSFTGQGTVTVTATQSGNATYAAATPVSRSVVVNAAVLTVTASSQTRVFGQQNPVFTSTITGFVNGDTQASATTGTPTLTTTAVPRSPAGAYPIQVMLSTLAAANYTFTLTNGQLTVNGGAAQQIQFPAIGNFTHGTSLQLAAIATSGLPLTYTVSSGNATITNGNTLNITGTGSITVTATQAGNASFSNATAVSQTFVAQ